MRSRTAIESLIIGGLAAVASWCGLQAVCADEMDPRRDPTSASSHTETAAEYRRMIHSPSRSSHQETRISFDELVQSEPSFIAPPRLNPTLHNASPHSQKSSTKSNHRHTAVEPQRTQSVTEKDPFADTSRPVSIKSRSRSKHIPEGFAIVAISDESTAGTGREPLSKRIVSMTSCVLITPLNPLIQTLGEVPEDHEDSIQMPALDLPEDVDFFIDDIDADNFSESDIDYSKDVDQPIDTDFSETQLTLLSMPSRTTIGSGQHFNWVITLSNTGDTPAHNVLVSVFFGDGVEPIAVPDSTGVVGSGAVRLTEIKTIAPGQTIEMEIKTLAQGTGDVAFCTIVECKNLSEPLLDEGSIHIVPAKLLQPKVRLGEAGSVFEFNSRETTVESR